MVAVVDIKQAQALKVLDRVLELPRHGLLNGSVTFDTDAGQVGTAGQAVPGLRHTCKVPMLELPLCRAINPATPSIRGRPKLLNVKASIIARKVGGGFGSTCADSNRRRRGQSVSTPSDRTACCSIHEFQTSLFGWSWQNPPIALPLFSPSPLPLDNDAPRFAVPPRPPTPDSPFEGLNMDYGWLARQRI